MIKSEIPSFPFVVLLFRRWVSDVFCFQYYHVGYSMSSQIARFMGPRWGLPEADRTQVGPMLAPWTLLSRMCANNRIHRGSWSYSLVFTLHHFNITIIQAGFKAMNICSVECLSKIFFLSIIIMQWMGLYVIVMAVIWQTTFSNSFCGMLLCFEYHWHLLWRIHFTLWNHCLYLDQWFLSLLMHLCVSRPRWWRHQMETVSALLAICAGNSPVTGEFPAQRPVTRSFDVFFDLCLNKRFSKHWWGWWFETQSCSLWRHCNEMS